MKDKNQVGIKISFNTKGVAGFAVDFTVNNS
jgi:hypothetical protein